MGPNSNKVYVLGYLGFRSLAQNYTINNYFGTLVYRTKNLAMILEHFVYTMKANVAITKKKRKKPLIIYVFSLLKQRWPSIVYTKCSKIIARSNFNYAIGTLVYRTKNLAIVLEHFV